MPIYWRYLLAHYLKILILSVLAFIAILLTMRLEEIAQFAALGPSLFHVVWFTLQQIPYILPIALPISAILSALLLMNHLSDSGELTALRASGVSLSYLFAPLLLMGCFLSLLNFFILSEISTATHLNAGLSKSQLRAINPLLLMSNKHVMKLKGFYFDVMGPSHVGEFVEDFVFVSPNKRTNRVNMMVAKRLKVIEGYLIGEQATFLTEQSESLGESLGESLEKNSLNEGKLLIENLESMRTEIGDFSRLFDKKTLSLNNDHLSFAQLLVRQNEVQQRLRQLQETGSSKAETHELVEQLRASWSEEVRRISVGVSVLSFTLMGLAFGMHASRRRSHWGLCAVIFLTTLFLAAFFIGKSFETQFLIAALLYLVPHLLIWSTSCYAVSRVSRGVG